MVGDSWAQNDDFSAVVFLHKMAKAVGGRETILLEEESGKVACVVRGGGIIH